MRIFTLDEINIPLPQTIHVEQPYVFLLYWLVAVILLSSVLKRSKKTPNLKMGLSTALSIQIIYLVCLLIYTFEPVGLQNYLAPLPFIQLREKTISFVVYEITENGMIHIPKFCSQVMSMFILAFLVNQIYAFKPANLKTPGWLVFRFFSIIFSIGVHFGVYKVLQKILGMIPADSFLETAVSYLPIGFLCILLCTFLLGWVKSIMKHFVEKINPTFEGLNGFYFTNKFGVNVTRAIHTTFLLTLFTFGLQQTFEKLYQVATIPISMLTQWGAIIPLVILFMLWVNIGRKL